MKAVFSPKNLFFWLVRFCFYSFTESVFHNVGKQDLMRKQDFFGSQGCCVQGTGVSYVKDRGQGLSRLKTPGQGSSCGVLSLWTPLCTHREGDTSRGGTLSFHPGVPQTGGRGAGWRRGASVHIRCHSGYMILSRHLFQNPPNNAAESTLPPSLI